MLGNLYAYCRVSTKDQKLERQEKNIKELQIDQNGKN